MANKCDTCKGTGEIKCSRCNGTGTFYPLPVTGIGAHPCSKCNGSGYIKPCPSCGGSGKARQSWSFYDKPSCGTKLGLCSKKILGIQTVNPQ